MDLIENHNVVLHLPLYEMHLDVGVTGCPPCTALIRTSDGCGRLRVGHPVVLSYRERQWLY